MEKCKWNFKVLGHYLRLTENNHLILLGKKEGQWVEIFNIY